MLVLSRKKDRAIFLNVNGKLIRVVVCEIIGDKVRIGIEADRDVHIWRDELTSIYNQKLRGENASSN